ncbi:hypothetical protein DEU56DRAFT_980133 [Suillus clintonianus]|uniref:uncharacterized protein n=1 Tax=Suillus clintonianus TaxID=1904413 RepID=UPI001B85FCFD|nr:uncharacterized protein DEU56DRAFT_980133 [Suillus clintonianus]KAG2140126.1 hypothetical protein DEU56DRAFT_980133 [Suillus clintonianus]
MPPTLSPRPDLPFKHQNPHISSLDLSKLPPVKYQSLDRDGHEVLVGRMKIPTPGGHAFILRRFDTGAISLTTMFRAAFPTASEADERRETVWVKDTYDLAGNNGSAKEPAIVRLAGTWVGPDVALLPEFAQTYGLGGVIPHVAKATPDPSAAYRRSSTKTTPKAAPRSSPAATSTLPTPAPSITLPTPKRRREASPVLVTDPPPSSLPPPRRSARTKSPAPVPVSLPAKSPVKPRSPAPRAPAHRSPAPLSPATKSPKTVKSSARAVRIIEVTTPGGSDETVVEEEAETIEIAHPNMSQDIAEQKELIERLKAERDAPSMETDSLKRAREDEDESTELRFQFKEPEVQERQIATNKRVGRFHLEPRQKSFAWGVAAFAIGMSAVSFLPNLF